MRGLVLFLALTASVPALAQDDLHPIQPGRKYAQIYPAEWTPAMCAVPSPDMVDRKYINYCLKFAPGVTPTCSAESKGDKHNRWKERKEGFYFEPYDCSWKLFDDPRKGKK